MEKIKKAPNASIQGPKVMLIDETAGSVVIICLIFFDKQSWALWLGKKHGRTCWNIGLS